jgi:hypothetical protein
MPRNETIDQINLALKELPDDRLNDLAALARAWTHPTAYSALSDADRMTIDAALDALDRGEGETWESVKVGLDAKLKAAGA